MFDYIKKDLITYLNNNNSNNAEVNGCKIFSTKMKHIKPNNINPPSINIVFNKHQINECSEYDLGDSGYVLSIQSFWIDIDKYAMIAYVEPYIDKWINKYLNIETEENEKDDLIDETDKCCPCKPDGFC